MTGFPFVYTSPMLQTDKDRVLKECPTGHILREAPYTYDTINMSAAVENADPIVLGRLPMYLKRAARIVNSERARLAELAQLSPKKMQNVADSKYATSRLRNGR